jgi:hypothetical protein
MVECRNCGHQGEGGFCRKCGAPLAKQQSCRNCGNQVEASARFCRGCGEPVLSVNKQANFDTTGVREVSVTPRELATIGLVSPLIAISGVLLSTFFLLEGSLVADYIFEGRWLIQLPFIVSGLTATVIGIFTWMRPEASRWSIPALCLVLAAAAVGCPNPLSDGILHLGSSNFSASFGWVAWLAGSFAALGAAGILVRNWLKNRAMVVKSRQPAFVLAMFASALGGLSLFIPGWRYQSTGNSGSLQGLYNDSSLLGVTSLVLMIIIISGSLAIAGTATNKDVTLPFAIGGFGALTTLWSPVFIGLATSDVEATRYLIEAVAAFGCSLVLLVVLLPEHIRSDAATGAPRLVVDPV